MRLGERAAHRDRPLPVDTWQMAITHAAAPPPTYMPYVHLEPTYMIYLKYLSRSAMTDSRRLRPTGGLFMSSTEPAKLVPT